MNMNHKCIWCGSPCEITLAFSSEGCSNPLCRAYKPPAPPVAKKSAPVNPPECDYCYNGNLLCNAGGEEECKECGRLRAEEMKKRDEKVDFNRNVRTGRLSSTGPNYSNLPRGDESEADKRKRITEIAIASGIAPDSSGSISKELMEKFLSSPDIYTSIACEMFGVHPYAVTPKQRSLIKQRVYGVIYGSDGVGMKDKLGTGVPQARRWWEVRLPAAQGGHRCRSLT